MTDVWVVHTSNLGRIFCLCACACVCRTLWLLVVACRVRDAHGWIFACRLPPLLAGVALFNRPARAVEPAVQDEPLGRTQPHLSFLSVFFLYRRIDVSCLFLLRTKKGRTTERHRIINNTNGNNKRSSNRWTVFETIPRRPAHIRNISNTTSRNSQM